MGETRPHPLLMTGQQMYGFLTSDISALATATSESVGQLQQWLQEARQEVSRLEVMNVVLARILVDKEIVTMEELDLMAKGMVEELEASMQAEDESQEPEDAEEAPLDDNIQIFGG